MINETELREKSEKSLSGNPALETQFEFFASVIAETAPEMPDIWHGSGRTGGKNYKNYRSLKFCWRNERNGRWIELSIYDTFAGSLNVNGNSVSIKSLVGETNARAAFESAFRYVFEAGK